MDLIRNSPVELKTIPDILRLQALQQPEAIAVIDRGDRITYRELARWAWHLAGKMATYRPHTVALFVSRSSTYLAAYFAGLSVGAILVPLDTNLTVAEISWTLKFCEVDALLFTEHDADLVEKLKNEFHSLVMIEIELQPYSGTEILPNKDVLELWPHEPQQVALLLHTSGSLANPKRVMLSHGGLICNASSHALHMGLIHEDRGLVLLPMHFGYCNTAQILTHLLLGGILIILPGIFVPQRCFKLIQEHKVTTLTAVPTMLLQMQAVKLRNKYDISSLKQVCFGGAPFPLERLQLLMSEHETVAFCQTYGQTEAGPRITGVKPADAHRWPNSVGTPIPGVSVKLLSSNGNQVAENDTGEIVVKSPSIMKGYFGDFKATAAALRNGWLYTGDLGKQGPDGEYYIVGRLKNFIIRGGINIYPEEIESVLLQHPAVKAALVIGMPHTILGEIAHAYVMINENLKTTANQLKEFASERLVAYKVPEIEFVNELPRTYNGKLRRISLDQSVPRK